MPGAVGVVAQVVVTLAVTGTSQMLVARAVTVSVPQ
jgi:hypothetical protein